MFLEGRLARVWRRGFGWKMLRAWGKGREEVEEEEEEEEEAGFGFTAGLAAGVCACACAGVDAGRGARLAGAGTSLEFGPAGVPAPGGLLSSGRRLGTSCVVLFSCCLEDSCRKRSASFSISPATVRRLLLPAAAACCFALISSILSLALSPAVTARYLTALIISLSFVPGVLLLLLLLLFRRPCSPEWLLFCRVKPECCCTPAPGP